MHALTITGRATADAVVGTGNQPTRFTIASKNNYRNKDTGEYETTFFDIAAFDKVGEIAAKLIKKGKVYALKCTLKPSTWEDKKDGTKKYQLNIIVQEIEAY